jgi:hypothetical protein
MSGTKKNDKKNGAALNGGTVSDEEASLRLSKALADFNKNAANLDKVAKEAKEIAEQYLNEYEEKITYKKRKIAEMDDEFRQQTKSKELQMLNNIREGGYAHALELLASRNPREIAVSEVQYQTLTAEIATLKQDMRQAVKEEVEKHKVQLEMHFQHLEETSRLKASTDAAKLQATVEQREAHIKVLEDQIRSLKAEVDAQRRLTQSISESFANAQKPTLLGGGGNNESYGSRSKHMQQ